MRTSIELDTLDSHLLEYSQYNITHHENIDDNIKKHNHIHRHGQNDEEHEHNHGHTKVSHKEIKLLTSSCRFVQYSVDIKFKNIFFNKVMTSTPHPFIFFRPPIS